MDFSSSCCTPLSTSSAAAITLSSSSCTTCIPRSHVGMPLATAVYRNENCVLSVANDMDPFGDNQPSSVPNTFNEMSSLVKLAEEDHGSDHGSLEGMEASSTMLYHSETFSHAASLHEEHGLDQLPPETANYATFASLLKRYGRGKILSQGRLLHAHLSQHKHDLNTFIGNCLVEMYGSCGSVEDAQAAFDNIGSPNAYSWNILMNAYAQNGFLEDAQGVFNKTPNQNIYSWNTLLKAYSTNGSLQRAGDVFREMPFRDVVSWTAMIAALSKHGHSRESLQLFHEMQSQNVKPNKVTFVCTLDACADRGDLGEGQDIHAAIIGTPYEKHVEVGNALIDMYGKCGSLDDAKIMFSKMSHHDIVTYNALLGALIENRSGQEALNFFCQLQIDHFITDKITYLYGLDACAGLAALEVGKEIHAIIVTIGYEQDDMVGSALVNMYGKCGSPCYALSVFNTIYQRDVISWNAIIAAFSQNGQGDEALEFFEQMHLEGLKPNKISFVCASDACASLGSLDKGHDLHAIIIGMGYLGDTVVGNALVNVYGKCGSPADAWIMFNQMHDRDVITWNAMIAAFAQNGHGNEALELFHHMQCEGMKGDNVTFLSVLSACAIVADLQAGEEIHTAIDDTEYVHNTLVGNALVHMYGKCGNMSNAWAVFHGIPQRDVASWNALLSALSQNKHGQEALDLFHSMQHEAIEPNSISFVCALDACVSLAALKEGQCIHSAIIVSGQEQNSVLENAIISLYVKCGALGEAKSVFSEMIQSDAISWNMIIAALSQNGYSEEAFDYFNEMQGEEIVPDAITFTCILTSCARMTAPEEGHRIHATTINAGLEQDTVVGNSLMSMYGKCACMEDAGIMFNRMAVHDVISWNAIIAAFSQNGHGKEALNMFCQMQLRGYKPDDVTFVCILMACTHTGQVDQGRHFFLSMEDFGITRTHAHYVYMIDLLSRAGHLDEAEDLINSMPFEETKAAWLHLLGACKTHGDLQRAVRAANGCLEMDATNAGPYVVLSNIYASAAEWDDDDVAHISKALKSNFVKDQPSQTLTEVQEAVHDLVMENILQLQVCKLNEELQRLTRERSRQDVEF